MHHLRVVVPTFVLLFSVAGISQQKATTKAPAPSVASGQKLYLAHCASCHGADGKGSGPAATALKVPPPDLTTLAKRNKGNFPREHVQKTISGEDVMSAHGSREMPVWGPVFLGLSGENEAVATSDIDSVTKYIQSIQAK